MQASQERFNIKWENIFTPLSRKLKSWLKESWTKTFPNFFPKFDNSFPLKIGEYVIEYSFSTIIFLHLCEIWAKNMVASW
jgi:hypothetical protein